MKPCSRCGAPFAEQVTLLYCYDVVADWLCDWCWKQLQAWFVPPTTRQALWRRRNPNARNTRKFTKCWCGGYDGEHNDDAHAQEQSW